MSEIDWDSAEIAAFYDKNCDHQYVKGTSLISMMNIREGDIVLDMGCGTGRQALNVSDIIGPAGRLIGIDPSSHRIKIADERLRSHDVSNVSLLVGRCEDLSAFANDSFDHAYFCSSFHWVDDKKAALREIFRVLRPGGSIAMTTLDRNNHNGIRNISDEILVRHGLKSEERTGFSGTKKVTAPELYDLLSGTGFSDIRIDPKSTFRHYASLEALLDHWDENRGLKDLLKNIPPDLSQQIMNEIVRELEPYRTPDGFDFESCTLFAIAKKT